MAQILLLRFPPDYKILTFLDQKSQYFDSDQKELKPMILKDIAEDLSIDILFSLVVCIILKATEILSSKE